MNELVRRQFALLQNLLHPSGQFCRGGWQREGYHDKKDKNEASKLCSRGNACIIAKMRPTNSIQNAAAARPGFAAKVRRQLGHKSDGQHLQQNAERIAASLPGQLLQPGQQWAQLLHREPQQPRRAAQRKQERKAGLVLF